MGLVRVDQSDPLAAGTADAQRQLGGHHLGASGPIFNAGIGTSGFTRGGAFAERRQQRIALVATKNTRRPCKKPAENSRGARLALLCGRAGDRQGASPRFSASSAGVWRFGPLLAWRPALGTLGRHAHAWVEWVGTQVPICRDE